MNCPICKSSDYVRIFINKPSLDYRNGIDRSDKRRKYIYQCSKCNFSEEDVEATDKLDNDEEPGVDYGLPEWDPPEDD